MNLKETYVGKIVDIDDPKRLGRARIRVPVLHGDDDTGIPTTDLPWANQNYNMMFGADGQSGTISIPKLNGIVHVAFDCGNIYSPEFFMIHELATDAQDQLNKEYEGTHIILFDKDVDLKIYYTLSKGLTVYHKGSYINLAKDGVITLEHAETRSIITMEGPVININADSQVNIYADSRVHVVSDDIRLEGNAINIGGPAGKADFQSAVLGQSLFEMLVQIAGVIDAKLQSTPGVTTQIVQKYRNTCLSDIVKISKGSSGTASSGPALA